MKKLLSIALTLIAIHHSLSAQIKNALNAKEQQQGWELLFNGENTHGWHVYLKKDAGAWGVSDGILHLDTKSQGRGDLITNKEYTNFELKLDWKIPEGGNSGIIFNVHEDTAYVYTYLTGIEMQILDNKGAEDNKQANHLAGSLYDLIAPAHPAKPAGEWNSVMIRKLNNHLTFWLNGQKVVETQVGNALWRNMLKTSKYKTWKAYATYPKGHIALQDHGAAVSFRNIRIRQL
ncbi:DUF1080 domain-containing protein [Mucilaginibacter sp. RCC_168]|uniref:3-keto-disaccharide hydrolase n=1 Tax=Mucilaginibacter sp. RCC_168 TaxID=3239221 RepID=UPI0035255CED